MEALPLGEAQTQQLRQLTLEHPLRLPVHIQFRVAALSCAARLEHAAPDAVHLHLSACMGHLPFSGEDDAGRRRVVAWIRHSAHQLPGRLRLDERGRLWIDQETRLARVPNTVEFLVSLCQLLFILLPDIGDALENLIPVYYNGLPQGAVPLSVGSTKT